MHTVTVLSLKSSLNRRISIEDQFNHFKKLNLKFFDAFSYKDVPKNLINHHISNKKLGRFLTKGEIGCSYSHFKILQKFISDNNKKYLVLIEDDVVLNKNFEQLLEDLIKSKNYIDNLIFFNSGYNFYRKIKTKVVINSSYSLYRSIGTTWGTYGMLISKRIARKMIKYYDVGIVYPADFYGRKFTDKPLKIYSVYPPPLYHPHMENNINLSIIGRERYQQKKARDYFIEKIINKIKWIAQWF